MKEKSVLRVPWDEFTEAALKELGRRYKQSFDRTTLTFLMSGEGATAVVATPEEYDIPASVEVDINFTLA